MSKKLKIILLVFGIVLAGIIAFLYFYNSKSNQANNPSPSQSSGSSSQSSGSGNVNTPPTPVGSGNTSKSGTDTNKSAGQYAPGTPFSLPTKDAPKMTLHTPSNTPIEVNNLYKNPAENLHLPDNSITFLENNDYQIAFYPKTEYFLIVLFNADLQKARDEAESAFLKTLGITKDQACQLNVNLGAPTWVNPNIHLGTANYGLSFCPNGKPFPAS
jgi:cytoskeletal protein RodZ